MIIPLAPRPFGFSVKVIIRDGQDRVLLLRRSASSKNNAGLWEFPGGKLDPGESFDQGLLREVREETGLTIRLERVLDAGSSELPERTVAYLFMEGRLLKGKVRLSAEHSASQWIPPEALAAKLAQENFLCPHFRAVAQSYCGCHGYGPPPPPAAEPAGVDAKWLAAQVRRYRREQPGYARLAGALKSVLDEAARQFCPLALVQARAKNVSSFAEKVVRKDKYQEPLLEITDL